MKKFTYKKRNKLLVLTLTALLGLNLMAANEVTVHADTTDTNNTFSALWTGKDGECDWSYDIVTRTLTISASERGNQLGTEPLSGQVYGLIPWSGWIEHINFATPVSLAINSGGKFNCLYSLKTIDNFNLVDTSKVVNMADLFSDDAELYKLDLSQINMSKVANVTQMFAGDKKLTQLDLSRLDISRVPAAKQKDMFTNSGLDKETKAPQSSEVAHSAKLNTKIKNK